MFMNFPRSRFFAKLLLASALFVSAVPASLACQSPKAGPPVLSAQATPPVNLPSAQSVPPVVNPEAKPPQSKTESYTLSYQTRQKAVAYSRSVYTLYFISYFVVIAGLFLLLKLGVVGGIRDFAQRCTEKRWLQGFIFIPALLALIDLLELPVSIYWHSLSLFYEQSVERWPAWFWDWTKEELLSLVVFAALGQILYQLICRSSRRWWFYFWLAMLPIALLLIIASPYIIDPLFNNYRPLAAENHALVESVAQLTQRAGVPIPAERMFLMDASKKTNTLNAYVAGLGPSKRVVVYDNTIRKTTPDETLFIIGHELGHYVLGHVWTGFLYFALGLLVGLYLMFRGLHYALRQWGAGWKVYGPQDWAALAILFLLMFVLNFISAPIVNGLSRAEEHAADVYGIEVIHGIVPNSEEVAAHAFQVLGEIDLSDPNPPAFIRFWLYSHPPLAERLVFVHRYDPWSRGKSPRYVK
jgi:STE24 endopeptidase